MTTSAELLEDAFGRIAEGAVSVVDGLTPADLTHRVAANANPIGWLVWHLLRVQDSQVADVAGTDQVWSSGWDQRFGLPYAPGATGYGQSSDEVGALTVTGELLDGYARAVSDVTRAYVIGLTDQDLDRVVDERWDPPVTLGVRLLSIIQDDIKHLGQAEYVRGLL
jgi:uncharacterized damage-inducible protein DinB